MSTEQWWVHKFGGALQGVQHLHTVTGGLALLSALEG